MDDPIPHASTSEQNSQNMEHKSLKENCSCKLALGIYSLSSEDIRNSCDFEKKFNLVTQAIDFKGYADESQRTTILNKIEKIKQYSSEYPNFKDVLAIPSEIPLHKYEVVLDELSKPEEKIKLQAEYLEDILHQKCIEALRLMDIKAFVMKGFNSGDCLKAKIEMGKNVRAKCKPDKNTAELNDHEKDIMEILEIKDIVDDNLAEFIDLHKQFVDGTLVKTDSDINKLFHKE